MRKIIICLLIMFAVLAPVTPVNAEEGDEETVELTDTFYVITTQEDCTLHVPFIHSSRTSLGSILLVTAGILIVVNTARGNSFLLHFISSGLHYMAVCMMASTGSGYMMPKVLQEEAAEQ